MARLKKHKEDNINDSTTVITVRFVKGDIIKTEYATISGKSGNKHNHSTPNTMKEWEKLSIKVCSTDENGNVEAITVTDVTSTANLVTA